MGYLRAALVGRLGLFEKCLGCLPHRLGLFEKCLGCFETCLGCYTETFRWVHENFKSESPVFGLGRGIFRWANLNASQKDVNTSQNNPNTSQKDLNGTVEERVIWVIGLNGGAEGLEGMTMRRKDRGGGRKRMVTSHL